MQKSEELKKIVFDANEMELLLNSDPYDYVLYMRLRWHMDKETRTVGEKFKVKKSELIAEMRVYRARGSTTKDKLITKDTFKACIDRLGEKGLVVVKSIATKDCKRLIFELPKAPVYQSVKKRNPPWNPPVDHDSQTIDNIGVDDEGALLMNTSRNPRYQYINNNTDVLLLYSDNHSQKEQKKIKGKKKGVKRLIPDNFEVTEQHVQFALDNDTPSPHDERIKFITYYQSKRVMRPDWDASFRNWLLKAKEIKDEKNRSNHQYQRQNKSYSEKLNEASRILEREYAKRDVASESNISADVDDLLLPLATDFDF
jgi:hypothetical protein